MHCRFFHGRDCNRQMYLIIETKECGPLFIYPDLMSHLTASHVSRLVTRDTRVSLRESRLNLINNSILKNYEFRFYFFFKKSFFAKVKNYNTSKQIKQVNKINK